MYMQGRASGTDQLCRSRIPPRVGDARDKQRQQVCVSCWLLCLDLANGTFQLSIRMLFYMCAYFVWQPIRAWDLDPQPRHNIHFRDDLKSPFVAQ